jgi:hypothetical protein
MMLSSNYGRNAVRTLICATVLVAGGFTLAVAATGPAPAPTPAAAAESHNDFTYGPLRFRVEALALDGSVGAKAKLSIENLSHSVARVVLASMAAARNGIGLELTSLAGAKCDAKDSDISDIKIVASEGETTVRTMTQIQALSRLTFGATFHCNTGRLSTGDKLTIHGRILTATEAGGFDIPLTFTELTATAK